MPWIVFLIVFAVCSALYALTVWLWDENHWAGIPASLATGASILAAIFFGVNALVWTVYAVNPEAHINAINDTRQSYVTMMSDYQTLKAQDVTASESYMTLYDKVVAFNKAVRKADRWEDTWWAEGWLYDPTYVDAEIIPIN